MTEFPPDGVLEVGAGNVLLGPVAARYVLSALNRVESTHRLDGIAPPVVWVQMRDAMARAASVLSVSESVKARNSRFPAESGPIGSGVSVGAGRVAEVLGCSRQWASTRLRRGDFATARRAGNAWRMDEDELLAWAVAQQIEAEAS